MKRKTTERQKQWQRAREKGQVAKCLRQTPEQAAIVRQKWEKRKALRYEMEKIKNCADRSILQRWTDRKRKFLTQRAQTILDAMPRLDYSMGSYCAVKIIKRRTQETIGLATRDTCRDYPNNCTWQATHGELILHLTPQQIMRARVIAGVITIAAKWPRKREKYDTVPCQWIEFPAQRGKMRSIEFVRGYLCGESHAETREEAERLERRKRTLKAEELLRKRDYERKARQSAAEREAQRQREERERAAKLDIYGYRVRLTRDDSYSCGNCVAGTEAWIDRAGLEGESITLAELAEAVRRCPSSFADRVLNNTLRRLPLPLAVIG